MSSEAKYAPREIDANETNDGRPSQGMMMPVMCGSIISMACYSLMPMMTDYRDLAERFLAGHPLQYATTTLFCIGLVVLALKWFQIGAENQALAADPLADGPWPSSFGPASRANALENMRREMPTRMRCTYLGERIRCICSYVRDRGSSTGLEDHLKYLAEQSSKRMVASYSVLRIAAGGMLIVGVLGSVLGMTSAAGNMDPKNYEASMASMMGQMAGSLDSTIQAAVMSLIVFVGKFLTQQREQEIVNSIEDWGTNRVVASFPQTTNVAGSIYSEAEALAAEQLLQRTDELIARQTKVWEENIKAMRISWIETVQKQKQNFDESLRQGQLATLNDHAKQLSRIREEFLQAFVNVSQELRSSLEEGRETQTHLQETFQQQIAELWLQVRNDLKTARDEESAHRAELVDAIAETVDHWQQQLTSANHGAAEQLEELRHQREALLQFVRSEQSLEKLQDRLGENLAAIRTTGAFEETLHSLNAAVHLLTNRVKPKAA